MFLVAIVEWETGYQLSFSVFYLLLLSFFAMHKDVSKAQIIFNACFTAAVELAVQLHSNEPFISKLIPFGNFIINLIGFLIVSFLCYSLKVKQASLIDLNGKLKEANIEKNRLIGITAHDLRSPFANIYMVSELLMKDEKNPERYKLLEVMDQTSRNSLRLVDNLLNIASIESGTVRLDIRSHDYLSFVRSIVRFHQVFADNKNLKITLECDKERLIFKYDEVHISQVISNLLMNAIKYSYPGKEVKIKISRREIDVLTEVIDDGVGIPEDEIGKLFNFFQKTSAKPTLGETGAGLGLAIAKKIVMTHEGIIGVKSELNKGSNFYFYLPA